MSTMYNDRTWSHMQTIYRIFTLYKVTWSFNELLKKMNAKYRTTIKADADANGKRKYSVSSFIRRLRYCQVF